MQAIPPVLQCSSLRAARTHATLATEMQSIELTGHLSSSHISFWQGRRNAYGRIYQLRVSHAHAVISAPFKAALELVSVGQSAPENLTLSKGHATMCQAEIPMEGNGNPSVKTEV